MKTTSAVLLALAATLPAVACSSTSSSSQNGGLAASGPLPQGPTTFTMQDDVAASSEAFRCQYVTMPPGDGFVVGGKNEFTPGSHHVVVYSTDLTSIPGEHAGIEDCYEGAGSMMTHIRGVVYAATDAKAGIDMPSGVGIPYKGGAVLLFQNHFLNAGGQAMHTQSQVYLETAKAGVTQNADVLFYYDPYVDVPVGTRAKASMRCPVPKDVTLVAFGSHYHSRGVGFQAFVDPPNGPPATTPFYTSTNWASPTIVTNQSLAVPGGSHIRYYCDFDNTQGTQEYVQGESATNNEMCMFIALYYPAMTAADDYCDAGDEVGTGTASCVDTLNCLAACPPAGDTSQTNGYSPCTQKCVVESCPGSAGPLGTVKACIQQNCAAACGLSGADAGAASDGGVSDACRTCVTNSCASEYLACGSAPCEAQ
jgi:hypothetical protein